jgi:hypothetical protein
MKWDQVTHVQQRNKSKFWRCPVSGAPSLHAPPPLPLPPLMLRDVRCFGRDR